jgi:hypothetical protein
MKMAQEHEQIAPDDRKPAAAAGEIAVVQKRGLMAETKQSCFEEPAHADAFRERFGGERLP